MKRKIKKQLIISISILFLILCFTPQSNADEYQNPTAIIDTSKGTIKIELYLDKVPITVENFVKLAEDGFYDGMIFHRIMDDFMIQAGNTFPDGSTTSSPYGPIDLEINEVARHVDGAISMARTNDPNSATSQFFICDGKQAFLDDNYAVFGVTTEGIEVVRDIADDDHDGSSPAGGGKPLEDIIINSIKIQGYQEALVNLADQINLVTEGADDIIHYTKKDDDFIYKNYYLQSSKPNIDIIQITFDIIDDKAVLSLAVSGEIVTDSELFEYYVTYQSSTVVYSFTYSNNDLFALSFSSCKNDSEESYIITDDTITVIFDCNESGFKDIELYGYAREYTQANNTLVENWFDYCPDEKGPQSILIPDDPISSNDSPGFELILVLFTVTLIFFIKKKKRF